MLTNPTQGQVVKKLNEIDSNYLDKSSIDSALSETSENPVQNRVINSKFNDIITTNQQITGELDKTFEGDNATSWHAGGSKTTGNWSITLGADAEAHQLSIALGNQSKALGGSDTILGSYAKRNDLTEPSGNRYGGVAIGSNSSIAGNNPIAIGSGAKIQLTNSGDGTIQLGKGTNTEAGTFQVKDYTLLDANGKIPSDRLPELSGDYVQYTEQTLNEEQQSQARTNISAQKDLGLKYSEFVSTPDEDDPSKGMDQFIYKANSSIAIGAGTSAFTASGTTLTIAEGDFTSYSFIMNELGRPTSYSAMQQSGESFAVVVNNDVDGNNTTKINSLHLAADSSTLELNRDDYGHALLSCALDTTDNKVKINARADSGDSTSIVEISDNTILLNIGVQQSTVKNSLKLTETSATLNDKRILTADDIGTTSGKLPQIGEDGKLSSSILPDGSSDAVKYTEQTLSEDQQTQARSNIKAQKDLGLNNSEFESYSSTDLSYDQWKLNRNMTGVGSDIKSTLMDGLKGTYIAVSEETLSAMSSSARSGSVTAYSYTSFDMDKDGFGVSYVGWGSSGTINNSFTINATGAKINNKNILTEDAIGTTSGKIPTLDSDGKLSESVIPRVAITDTFVVNSEAEMLALSTAEVGDVAIRTDVSETFILQAEPYSTLDNWKQILSPTGGVTSVNGKTGAVTITASDLNALEVSDNLKVSDEKVVLTNGSVSAGKTSQIVVTKDANDDPSAIMVSTEYNTETGRPSKQATISATIDEVLLKSRSTAGEKTVTINSTGILFSETPLVGDNQTSIALSTDIPAIVDNLTTSDATKALSSNQGKVLNTKISETDQQITTLQSTITDLTNNKVNKTVTFNGFTAEIDMLESGGQLSLSCSDGSDENIFDVASTYTRSVKPIYIGSESENNKVIVKSEFQTADAQNVKLTGDQDISGVKNFTGTIKINGGTITYDSATDTFTI